MNQTRCRDRATRTDCTQEIEASWQVPDRDLDIVATLCARLLDGLPYLTATDVINFDPYRTRYRDHQLHVGTTHRRIRKHPHV
jgi:hypothetical protein